MQDAKSGSKRRTRKPRHGWFDYEVLDVFGDDLGSYGLAAYMVLARECYGGYSVTLGSRAFAAEARMKKDKLLEVVAVMEKLGLVVVHKGPTPKSAPTYDLMDVKDLVDEMRSTAKLLRANEQSVCVADSSERSASRGAQNTLVNLLLTNRHTTSGDAAMGTQEDGEGTEDLETSDVSVEEDTNCLPHRQISFSEGDGSEKRENDPASQSHLSENTLNFQTHLSENDPIFQTRLIRSKKEETRRELNTPLPPASGGSEISHANGNGETLVGLLLRENSNGQSKNLPDEGQNNGEHALTAKQAEIQAHLGSVTPAVKLAMKREFEMALVVTRAMRAHGLSTDRRNEDVIRDAFELWCSKTGGTPEDAANLEATNFGVWEANSGMMFHNWGFRWWFKRGFWCQPNKWPFDKQKLNRMRQTNIGKNPYPEGPE